MLLGLPQRDAGDQERQVPGDQLDAFDHDVGLRILPAPQIEAPGPAAPVLGEPEAGTVPVALEPGGLAVVAVRHGEERAAAPGRRHDLDLEPFTDRHSDRLAAGQVEHVVGDGRSDAVPCRSTGLQQPVRDDHPPRRPADLDRDRRCRYDEAPLLRRSVGADQERQAAKLHPAQRQVACRVLEGVDARVAHRFDCHRFITGHRAIVTPDFDMPTDVFAHAAVLSRTDAASARRCRRHRLVAELNRRAPRSPPQRGRANAVVRLADGNRASIGDVIITRSNDRRLRVTTTDGSRTATGGPSPESAGAVTSRSSTTAAPHRPAA